MIVVRNVLFICLGLYVLICLVLYFTQRSLIYIQDTVRYERLEGAQSVSVRTADGLDILGWYFPPVDETKYVLVHFHGNGPQGAVRVPKLQAYLDNGYGLLLAEYRGYGGNPGSLSEGGLYEDGRAYLRWLNDYARIPLDRVVLYGESLGSGPAVQMATEFDARALVLEAPFSSMLDMARFRYPFIPVRWMLKDKYLNLAKIRDIDMNLLVLHGVKDSVIPYSQAEALSVWALEPKEFVSFPEAGHNNLYEYGAARHVLGFMDALALDALSE